ncbi:MAG TPA: condensation domain-containing protein, partial [Aggregatilineales bacterium]|nr:condensation domain-containing protein [Aggregatilineales bacterium]
NGDDISPGKLREFLAITLPQYMLPSLFVQMDEFPLTPNGKINRRALPKPEMEKLETGQEYVAPRNATEEQLAGIWAELLKVSRVGVNDNFFELGGHSLLAARLIAILEREFDRRIPLATLFDNPTVERIAREMTAGEELDAYPPIEPVSRNEAMPLSESQQRMWFLSQLESSSSAYNVPMAYRLRGRLDVDALEASFQFIIQRHEVLRTVFVTEEGIPGQTILDKLPFSLSVEAAEESQIRSIITEASQQVIDITQSPLMIVRLWRLSEDEHILLVVVHHIIFDGWSEGVLTRELNACYRAYVQGETPELEPLPIQYADFAAWRRNHSDLFVGELDYWSKQLSGSTHRLQLPTDRPYPKLPSYRGGEVHYRPEPDLIERLNRISRQNQVTLYVTILSAFEVMLYRYTGQEDILVGSVVAGRNYEEIQNLLGVFINTVVVRAFMDGEMRFDEFMRRMRETVIEAYDHSRVPFERVIDRIQPERDLSTTPLFQVMFNLINTGNESFETGGVSFQPIDFDTDTTPFDLYFEIGNYDNELQFDIRFNTDIFDRDTIERMAQHYDTILRAVVDNPQAKIGAIPLLSADEEEQLLKRWNQTQAEYPDVCLHEWFEDQVERTPDAIAAMAGGEAISYGDLNARANQLAHYLRKFGVEPDMLVGVHIDRSLDMLVAVLGVMKAGGAYVPLDPDFPKDRLEIIVEDSD